MADSFVNLGGHSLAASKLDVALRTKSRMTL